MRLTDLAIKSFPLPEQGQRDYSDDTVRGLTLRVGKSRKTFMLLIRNGESRTRVKLGTYPEISLSKARELARAKLAEPRAEIPDVTFEEALQNYYRIHGPKQRAATRKHVRQVLNKHFRPRLSKLPVETVTTAQLAAIVDTIPRSSVRHSAYVAITSFFTWCYRRGYVAISPDTRLEPAPPNPPREHVPSFEDIRRIWHACPDSTYGQIVKLCIVSAQRVGQWEKYRPEFRQGDVIVFPADVMKAGRVHDLPVTPLLESLLPAEPFDRRLDSRSKERLDRASGVSGWRVHDFRRTFATYAVDELDIAPHIVEAVLAHASGSQVARTYNRAKLLQPMRAALLAYENWLRQIVYYREPFPTPEHVAAF